MRVYDVRALPGDSGFLVELDGKFFLYDNGFGFTGAEIVRNVKEITARVDFQFLTHSHYDHAGGTPFIKRAFACPVVAGSYAAKIFAKDSAKALMRELDGKFARENGVDEYEDLFDLLAVDIAAEDGALVSDSGFVALALPGHTRCSVGYYRDGLLLSCETLGLYRGDSLVVPSYLVSVEDTLRAIDRVQELDVKTILLPHYGVMGDVKTYLTNARENALKTRDQIVKILKSGTREDAINWFCETYYNSAVASVYPKAAMLLNTGITVDLIARECV